MVSHALLAPPELTGRSRLRTAPEAADAAALLTPDGGRLSHAELRARVAVLAAQLPPAEHGRRLVHVPLAPDPGSVAAYLAVLEAGHVALVTAEDGPPTRAILERYPADLRVSREHDGYETLAEAPQHLLHPDLALLLSTSGSTGSPKLVRLSHANLLGNAAAIAAALSLSGQDRGITSLPLHYCYGLSVLHSHLHAGASVLLSGHSVLDEAFWDAADGQGSPPWPWSRTWFTSWRAPGCWTGPTRRCA